MAPQAPTWWRWVIPVFQQHGDLPHLCDLLDIPIWIVDDARREVIDRTMASISHAVGQVDATAPIPGMAALITHVDGYAWPGRLRALLRRDGFYQKPGDGMPVPHPPPSPTKE